jgi:hypothetical protein
LLLLAAIVTGFGETANIHVVANAAIDANSLQTAGWVIKRQRFAKQSALGGVVAW